MGAESSDACNTAVNDKSVAREAKGTKLVIGLSANSQGDRGGVREAAGLIGKSNFQQFHPAGTLGFPDPAIFLDQPPRRSRLLLTTPG